MAVPEEACQATSYGVAADGLALGALRSYGAATCAGEIKRPLSLVTRLGRALRHSILARFCGRNWPLTVALGRLVYPWPDQAPRLCSASWSGPRGGSGDEICGVMKSARATTARASSSRGSKLNQRAPQRSPWAVSGRAREAKLRTVGAHTGDFLTEQVACND
jgi:hypothetical protein